MAPDVHVAEVVHDRPLIASYVRFRSARFWPSRKLQRALIAGILVAAGFLVPAGTLRWVLWAAAVAVAVWVVAGDWATVQWHWARDPYRRAGVPERIEFGPKEFARAMPAEGGGADTERFAYAQVIDLLRDESCWYLVLRDRTLLIIDRRDVDGGEGSPKDFTRFLEQRTGRKAELLDTSLAETMRTVQRARRGYLDERAGTGLFGGRRDRGGAGASGDATDADGAPGSASRLDARDRGARSSRERRSER